MSESRYMCANFDGDSLCASTCASPSDMKKNIATKAFDEFASTDTGGEDLGVDAPSAESGSDSEALEDLRADDSAELGLSMPMGLVYSLAMMLQVRLAVRGKGTRSPLQPSFATRSIDDCPAEVLPAPAHETYTKPRTPLEKFLSKATPATCNALYEAFSQHGLQTPESIWTVVKGIFDKAQLQHELIPMYADLIERIASDPRAAPALTTLNVLKKCPDSFRRLLLEQCQETFEQLFAPYPDDAGEEELALRKQRSLGGVKLVGQLMVRGMLQEKLLCKLLEGLLGGREASPDSLESLVALLTVVGKKFDVATWHYFKKFEAIFAQIKELSGDKKVPSRARLQLTRLLDLRNSNWILVDAPAATAPPPLAPLPSCDEPPGLALLADRSEIVAAEDEVQSPQAERKLSADAATFVPHEKVLENLELARKLELAQDSSELWAGAGARILNGLINCDDEPEDSGIDTTAWCGVGASIFIAMVGTEDDEFLDS